MLLGNTLIRTKEPGFSAIQFECVVCSNERAIGARETYGFAKVGCLRLNGRHSARGSLDVLETFKHR
jgi:hypothetical protein